MKRLIYAAAALCVGLGFAACDDDPEDAVSKHVYGPDENPYLRTDTSATISISAEFRKGNIAPKTINLKDYADKIQSHLFMTVDDMLEGLDNGSVAFYNINTTRGAWNKTAQNVTGGWGYSKSGVITNTNQAATLTLDKANKQLVVDMPDDAEAGTLISVNVGFAIDNGRDFDNYIRFSISVAVTDPGTVMANITVPLNDDYEVEYLYFSDEAIKSAIETCLGISYEEFIEDIQKTEYSDDRASATDWGSMSDWGDIALYMVDADGNWLVDSPYSADQPGYWLSTSGLPTTWGADDCLLYMDTWSDDEAIAIGPFPGMSATTVTLHFVYASRTDNQKYVEFIVNVTLE